MISTILLFTFASWVWALLHPFTHPGGEVAVWIAFLLVGSVFWYRWFRKNRVD